MLADNQKASAVALEQTGAVLTLETPQDIPHVFLKYLSDDINSKLKSMGQAASSVNDGNGVQRIVATLMGVRQLA
jgi:UDP-N-acetylglucosamine:LPS N-acetylglucosamine transferase